ncbi:MAG: hypothetical protein GEU88_03080 [Solirubrobacterales bacterium]|nr:hypothetical protein [Solirubrobacterales bacterium]
MDFSRLNRTRVLLGGLAALLLVVSILFLPWFSLTHSQTRIDNPDGAFICGDGDYSCTGFETFPILRWLLLAAALAPLILAWILVRGHRLSWAPGEMTMVVGFAAFVLILYNGVIDRPGSTFGVGLDYGYWIALISALGIAATGFTRSVESAPRKTRKAPGTV